MTPAEIGLLIQGGTALYNTFGKNNPSRAAGNELGKIPGYGQEAYNPFIKQGQNAMGQLGPQYSQMAGNPTDFYNNIMSQYKPSAGYQYQADKLGQAAHNNAAAGGFAGTGGHNQMHGELLQQLLGGDMQQFLSNILGIQGSGQQGLQRQADTGFIGSGGLADYLGSAAGQQGGFNAYGRHEQNANRNEGLSALSNLLGGIQKPQAGGTQFDLPGLLKQLFGGGGAETSAGSQIGLNKIQPTSFIQQGQSPYMTRT